MAKKTSKRRGRGEGGIGYIEATGLWYATISLGHDGEGRRKRKRVYGKTKGEVQEKLRELQTRAGAGELKDGGKVTLAVFLKEWLEMKRGKVASHTLIPYERDVNKCLIPHLGGVKLADLTALHVQRLYADLTADKVSPAMQRKAGGTLRTALQHAVHPLGLIRSNPASDVPRPRHEAEEMHVLDAGQTARFLAAAKGDRLAALYQLAIDSAARQGELFALSWADIDFAGSAVVITKSLEEVKGQLLLKEPKTKKSRRRIAVSSVTMEALADHRAAMLREGHYGADRPVFCDTDGGFLRKSNVLRRSFRPVIARANAEVVREAEATGGKPALLPPIRPYDLRHTGATLLLLAGVSPKVVSERLGHSTVVLTLGTYSHVLPGMQEQAASKLDAIFRTGTQKAAQ